MDDILARLSVLKTSIAVKSGANDATPSRSGNTGRMDARSARGNEATGFSAPGAAFSRSFSSKMSKTYQDISSLVPNTAHSMVNERASSPTIRKLLSASKTTTAARGNQVIATRDVLDSIGGITSERNMNNFSDSQNGRSGRRSPQSQNIVDSILSPQEDYTPTSVVNGRSAHASMSNGGGFDESFGRNMSHHHSSQITIRKDSSKQGRSSPEIEVFEAPFNRDDLKLNADDQTSRANFESRRKSGKEATTAEPLSANTSILNNGKDISFQSGDITTEERQPQGKMKSGNNKEAGLRDTERLELIAETSKTRITALEMECECLRKHNNEMKTQIENMYTTISRKEADAEIKVVKQAEVIKDLMDEVRSLKEELKTMRQKNELLQMDLDRLEEQNEKLDEKNDVLQRNLQATKMDRDEIIERIAQSMSLNELTSLCPATNTRTPSVSCDIEEDPFDQVITTGVSEHLEETSNTESGREEAGQMGLERRERSISISANRTNNTNINANTNTTTTTTANTTSKGGEAGKPSTPAPARTVPAATSEVGTTPAKRSGAGMGTGDRGRQELSFIAEFEQLQRRLNALSGK